MPRSEFERALGAAEHRAGRAAVELARTRRLLEREDMAGKLREMRREKERMQGAVDSLESENAKLREALEKWKKSR